MNRRAVKCKHCQQAFEPRRVDQVYCSHRCRQAAYRHRHADQPKPKRPPRAALLVTCTYCGGSFWAHRASAHFCSTSCRTMHHRALRDAIPSVLHHLAGISEKQAGDLVEVQPIGELRGFLERAGYGYVHAARRWLPTS